MIFSHCVRSAANCCRGTEGTARRIGDKGCLLSSADSGAGGGVVEILGSGIVDERVKRSDGAEDRLCRGIVERLCKGTGILDAFSVRLGAGVESGREVDDALCERGWEAVIRADKPGYVVSGASGFVANCSITTEVASACAMRLSKGSELSLETAVNEASGSSGCVPSSAASSVTVAGALEPA